MQNDATNLARNSSQQGLHLVFGSGGSKAILGGAGAILAFEVAGIHRFETIGSCSGGSLPGIILASGLPTPATLRLVIQSDFSRLLEAKTWLPRRLLALLLKYRNEAIRPQEGVYSSRPLTEFVRSNITKWPSNFWTVASSKRGQYLFTSEGVYFYCTCARPRKLITAAPTMEVAIASTVAVPGFIDGVRFAGDLLHDGAFSADGECPAAVSVRHFKADPSRVIAFDVAEEPIKKNRWLQMVWKMACGSNCPPFDGTHLTKEDGYVLIQPVITGFHGLQFNLSVETKWRAISIGMLTTAATLLRHGLVPAANRDALVNLGITLMALLQRKKGAAYVNEVERTLIDAALLNPKETL